MESCFSWRVRGAGGVVMVTALANEDYPPCDGPAALRKRPEKRPSWAAINCRVRPGDGEVLPVAKGRQGRLHDEGIPELENGLPSMEEAVRRTPPGSRPRPGIDPNKPMIALTLTTAPRRSP